MTLTLSAFDRTRLDAALRTLLSPLAFESVRAWRQAVSQRTRTLLQADKACCFLALAGEEFLVGEDIDAAGFDAYAAYYWKLDVGYHQQRKALGFEVNNLAMVYDMSALPHAEVYNDFSRQYRFLDALAA